MNDPKRTLETLELAGGALCLDFANTINSRREPEHDYLVTYSDLVNWAGKVEILSPQQAKRLKQKAVEDAQAADKALEKGRAAREIIYRVFAAIAGRATPQDKDLSAIARLFLEAGAHGQLVKIEDHYELAWQADEALDALLWRIFSSAEKLLLSEGLHLVKACPGCGWLFLDTSKNQSRRWCSMNTCGARDKMRRYHHRLRQPTA